MATYNAGAYITAADINQVKDVVNTTLTKYGLTNLGQVASAGAFISSANITTLKDQLTLANNNSNCVTKSDLSVIASFAVGDFSLASTLENLTLKAQEIYNNYCTCQCHYCTCQCHYCTCQCHYCTCQCNYCGCNYSCTCNCDNSCGNCFCDASKGDVPCQHWTCILPNQMIYTSAGPRAVRDIKVGDYVLTHTGKFSRVLDTWKSYNAHERLIAINTKYSSTFMTEDHPVYVESLKIKPLVIAASDSPIKVSLPQYVRNSNLLDENNDFYLKKGIALGESFVKLAAFIVDRGDFEDIRLRINLDSVTEAKLYEQCMQYMIDIFGTAWEIAGDFLGIPYKNTSGGDRLFTNIPYEQFFKALFYTDEVMQLPAWIHEFDNVSLTSLINTIEKLNDGVLKAKNTIVAYQLKLILAQLGFAAVIHDGILEYESINESSILVTGTDIVEYKDDVYNMVVEDDHTYATDIILCDGDSCWRENCNA